MTLQPFDQNTDAPTERPEPTKKPYETPKLAVHGTIVQITEATAPGNTDGSNGSTLFGSDRAIKQGVAAIDPQDILARLVAVPVTSWAYSSDASVRHIGPMAKDFMTAFGVGGSDKYIHLVDANGVAMAAIQALYAMIQQRDAQIGSLRHAVNSLKEKMAN